MLFLLRQLRRLELHKRSGRYFLYAFGEIVLIVVGILIALPIGQWNQERKDRLEERLVLERIAGRELAQVPQLRKTIFGHYWD